MISFCFNIYQTLSYLFCVFITVVIIIEMLLLLRFKNLKLL